MSEPKDTTEKTIGASIEAALVGAASGGVALAIHGPGAVLAGALVGGVATGLSKAVQVCREARLQRLVENILRGEGAPTLEDAAQQLTGLASSNADVLEALLGVVRDLEAAVDDSVAGPLGALASSYIRSRTPVDWFFRGFSRLLRDLRVDELAALRMLCTVAATLDGDGGQIEMHAAYSPGLVMLRRDAKSTKSKSGGADLHLAIPARLLFRGLYFNALAEEGNGSNFLRMSVETIANMNRIFRAAGEP